MTAVQLLPLRSNAHCEGRMFKVVGVLLMIALAFLGGLASSSVAGRLIPTGIDGGLSQGK